MDYKIVPIEKSDDANVIIGMSHFIKTVEDVYEAMVNSVPGAKFGVAFSEASMDCLVRYDGTDEELAKLAAKNLMNIKCGHSFIVIIEGAFPINFLRAIMQVPEVCTIYAATANPVKVVTVGDDVGNGIVGVIDGNAPKGIEDDEKKAWRHEFLRKIGYKR